MRKKKTDLCCQYRFHSRLICSISILSHTGAGGVVVLRIYLIIPVCNLVAPSTGKTYRAQTIWSMGMTWREVYTNGLFLKLAFLWEETTLHLTTLHIVTTELQRFALLCTCLLPLQVYIGFWCLRWHLQHAFEFLTLDHRYNSYGSSAWGHLMQIKTSWKYFLPWLLSVSSSQPALQQLDIIHRLHTHRRKAVRRGLRMICRSGTWFTFGSKPLHTCLFIRPPVATSQQQCFWLAGVRSTGLLLVQDLSSAAAQSGRCTAVTGHLDIVQCVSC